ncbi:hypothetical protein EYZ11_004780 [Aspergillus tanneri]|uniref:Altered inheritance of mitochondria protein 21 n=1 Tax=Aspergillus tanneri TaxID=1220188 RepID=A0A4S3JQH4_9EURO|nr:uncharacterized protein ATNIH1004_007603 [Aspergillus tanneri]KAA8646177.1 hypothetical protein ATNIH1004_007603 [Aspergillus tanneri]THC95741.1 hypothetical protein EYZ11_004780 [Aspergillus tanneri]
MTQTGPVIPPRPSRSPQQQGLTPASADIPRIPPRPSRRAERSVSPLGDSYAPSPLNELPNSASMSRTSSNDIPQRPPSVTIPSLGEEGIEYEDLDVGNASDSHHPAPAETRNVGSDLKLHAPRPSLPTSSAKARVQAVTRTDSRQAAAAGLGGRTASPVPDELHDRPARSLHSRASGSRADSSTASADRRPSLNGDEHGIPEIGQRVPMYRNAGDVQAPSPSPYQLEHGGLRTGRSHNRSRSGREASLPPGSYGLHGHGVQFNDKFEKAWYEKHPEEYVKEEQGQYGPGVGSPRPDWALSSDDLNKIVRGSAVTGSGLGTSPAVTGTPEEEVGYIASDEYTQRLSTPPPDSYRDSRPSVESSLRKESVVSSGSEPQQEAATKEVHRSEESGVIHVDEPYHHLHHPDGFAQTPDPETLDHVAGEGGAEEDEPILAADEVCPESAFQHPAVSPTFGRRESFEHESRSRTPSLNQSRSNSRSTSQVGGMPSLARFNSREEREDSHTPLEDVDEYEPLFPDDDKKDQKMLSAAERFKKRPEMLKRFPSQDIWEDSPNSLQLHATVLTPDIPKLDTFETPEQESIRRSQTSHVDPYQVASHILESEDHDEKSDSRRDASKQRFPSRDIWEDAPESQKLVTTIVPSEEEAKSPEVPSKPIIQLRPENRPQQPPPVDASTKPATSPTEKRLPPQIPDRPKPQIPIRPAKPASHGNTEEAKDTSAKVKPAVPARPGGSKIAALKAGFLSDLNSRLQLGPQAPKPQEKKADEAPAEKAPLSDARKGRARGPARRKPAVENTVSKLPTIPEIRITMTWNVWQVGEDGNLIVGDGEKAEPKEATVTPPDTSLSTDNNNNTNAPLSAENSTVESIDPQLTSNKEGPLASPKAESTFTNAARTIPGSSDDTLSASEPAGKQAERDEPPSTVPTADTDATANKMPRPSYPEEKSDNISDVKAASADGDT